MPAVFVMPLFCAVNQASSLPDSEFGDAEGHVAPCQGHLLSSSCGGCSLLLTHTQDLPTIHNDQFWYGEVYQRICTYMFLCYQF